MILCCLGKGYRLGLFVIPDSLTRGLTLVIRVLYHARLSLTINGVNVLLEHVKESEAFSQTSRLPTANAAPQHANQSS